LPQKTLTLLNFEPVDLVPDAALGQQLLLIDAHQRVEVDAGVQHVVRVHRVLRAQRLKTRTSLSFGEFVFWQVSFGEFVFWQVCFWRVCFWRVCLLASLSFGKFVFWQVCLLASLSFGEFVFWRVCLLASLSFGKFVFWRVCLLASLSFGEFVFLRVEAREIRVYVVLTCRNLLRLVESQEE
jgi:hypothetical protein